MTREELDEKIRVLTMRRDIMRALDVLPIAKKVSIKGGGVSVEWGDNMSTWVLSPGLDRRVMDGVATVLASILAEEDEREERRGGAGGDGGVPVEGRTSTRSASSA